MFRIVRTNATDKGYQELVTLLDADLRIRDGEDHAFFAQYNKSTDIKNVVVYYHGAVAAGCGAFKFFANSSVEIKRMFVRPEWRGKHIATKILTELEVWAYELNFSECVLETGKRQPDTVALYEKRGYKLIPNYGQYAGKENSVCFEKEL